MTRPRSSSIVSRWRRSSTGAFSLGRATIAFSAIVAGELVWGIGVGWLMLRLRRWVRDPRIEITLSVLTPYVAFWPPQHLGGSGVLATVTVGLYMSWNGFRLISAATRLQGIFFWDFLIYLIEGMLFLITGLQARAVVAKIGDDSVSHLAGSALLITRGAHRRAFRLDISGDLPAPLAHSRRQARRPFAALAVGVRAVLHRHSRRRLARGGARDPADDAERRAVPRARPHSLSDILRHPGDAGRAGRRHARRDACARPRQCEPPRTPRRSYRGAGRAAPRRRGRPSNCSTGSRRRRLFQKRFVETFRAAHLFRLLPNEILGGDTDRHGKFAELRDEIDLELIAAEREPINDLYCGNKLTDEARRRLERELDLREADVANSRDEIERRLELRRSPVRRSRTAKEESGPIRGAEPGLSMCAVGHSQPHWFR